MCAMPMVLVYEKLPILTSCYRPPSWRTSNSKYRIELIMWQRDSEIQFLAHITQITWLLTTSFKWSKVIIKFSCTFMLHSMSCSVWDRNFITNPLLYLIFEFESDTEESGPLLEGGCGGKRRRGQKAESMMPFLRCWWYK